MTVLVDFLLWQVFAQVGVVVVQVFHIVAGNKHLQLAKRGGFQPLDMLCPD